MTSLDLSRRGLTSMPPVPRDVTRLDLYSNQIASVPASLWECTGLQVLNLASNRLSSLPPGISALSSLHTLDTSSTRCRTSWVTWRGSPSTCT